MSKLECYIIGDMSPHARNYNNTHSVKHIIYASILYNGDKMTFAKINVELDVADTNILSKIRAEIARIISEQLQSDPNSINSFSVSTVVEVEEHTVE